MALCPIRLLTDIKLRVSSQEWLSKLLAQQQELARLRAAIEAAKAGDDAPSDNEDEVDEEVIEEEEMDEEEPTDTELQVSSVRAYRVSPFCAPVVPHGCACDNDRQCSPS